jgi:23S rRNA pseudouridine1911/1915/1917 synthase
VLSINDFNKPQILAVEKDFLLVYKPPRMHSAPLANSQGDTILDWTSSQFPEVADLSGRRAGEGGLLHRLDFETQGLMLFAKSSLGMETLLLQQKKGKIIKEYSALTAKSETRLSGFPIEKPQLRLNLLSQEKREYIESSFRAYGPGRKTVRPLALERDEVERRGEIYTTEILRACSVSLAELSCISFKLRIRKGFRHQIRVHLAWLGLPIINDRLYGGLPYGNGLLALRASFISFSDPSSGEDLDYSIPDLEPSGL